MENILKNFDYIKVIVFSLFIYNNDLFLIIILIYIIYFFYIYFLIIFYRP